MYRTVFAFAGGAVVVALVITGLVFYLSNAKILPHTSFGPGHSESYPSAQINTQPIQRAIQEHVMEQGGTHPTGGMLIQYNCFKYQCEPDLPDKLADVVSQYPPQVYLAPYPAMDAKIAMAALGRLEVLDSFDEQRIRDFIERNLNR